MNRCMDAVTVSSPASPSISRWLMIATYAVGGFGLAMSFNSLGSGDRSAAASWAAAVAVGGSGLLSFVRHSVFHRSDAARMHWDYGRRNDFQIEVGLANLSWGLVGLAAWILDWGTKAEGSITLVFGLYLLGRASSMPPRSAGPRNRAEVGTRRPLPPWSFAAGLLVCGVAAVTV